MESAKGFPGCSSLKRQFECSGDSTLINGGLKDTQPDDILRGPVKKLKTVVNSGLEEGSNLVSTVHPTSIPELIHFDNSDCSNGPISLTRNENHDHPSTDTSPDHMSSSLDHQPDLPVHSRNKLIMANRSPDNPSSDSGVETGIVSIPASTLPELQLSELQSEGISSDSEDSLISEMSDISGLSVETWRPPTNGAMAWVQQQIENSVSPRLILSSLIGSSSCIPQGVDDLTIWRIILNIISEPPKRPKLSHINTMDDVLSLLQSSKRILVLTGAGVSVSCGIPDFRSKDGIYSRLAEEYPDLPDPQAMFDIHFFKKNPRPFFKFAREIYPGKFRPSRSHRFIKQLESCGKLLRNFTQNIDTLEKVAGIQNVIECHGSFATATCMNCHHKVSAETIKEDIMNQIIPYCSKCEHVEGRNIMKPDIVFFGESLPKEFHQCMEEDKTVCDLLIVIGSSLKVRPVALIPNSLPANVPQILINREPLKHLNFDVELLGDCDNITEDLCLRLGDSWLSECCQDSLPSTQLLPTSNYHLHENPSISIQDDKQTPVNCCSKTNLSISSVDTPSCELESQQTSSVPLSNNSLNNLLVDTPGSIQFSNPLLPQSLSSTSSSSFLLTHSKISNHNISSMFSTSSVSSGSSPFCTGGSPNTLSHLTSFCTSSETLNSFPSSTETVTSFCTSSGTITSFYSSAETTTCSSLRSEISVTAPSASPHSTSSSNLILSCNSPIVSPAKSNSFDNCSTSSHHSSVCDKSGTTSFDDSAGLVICHQSSDHVVSPPTPHSGPSLPSSSTESDVKCDADDDSSTISSTATTPRDLYTFSSGDTAGKLTPTHSTAHQAPQQNSQLAPNPKRVNLAKDIRDGTFLFYSPNRYIYPGAEVWECDDSSDEDEDCDLQSVDYEWQESPPPHTAEQAPSHSPHSPPNLHPPQEGVTVHSFTADEQSAQLSNSSPESADSVRSSSQSEHACTEHSSQVHTSGSPSQHTQSLDTAASSPTTLQAANSTPDMLPGNSSHALSSSDKTTSANNDPILSIRKQLSANCTEADSQYNVGSDSVTSSVSNESDDDARSFQTITNCSQAVKSTGQSTL